MPKPVVMSASRTFDAAPEQTFDIVLNGPLEELLPRRSGAFPAVRSTDEPDGWGAVGRARTVRLADRTTSREELVSVEPNKSFGYRLTELTGPMKLIATSVDGLFTFASTGKGSRVTWQWTLHPRSIIAVPILPLLVKMWQGWAKHAMDSIQRRSRAT